VQHDGHRRAEGGDVVGHTLHYGLIAVGSVLVVALLWRGRARRRAGGDAVPAHPDAEHERRVAELRDAAAEGRLGRVPTEPERPDRST
jgi:hypothetical protein